MTSDPITDFEQLGSLRPPEVQELLRNVQKSDLVTALRGASESLSSLIFSNMSVRAGQILREELDAHGDVEQANHLIRMAS